MGRSDLTILVPEWLVVVVTAACLMLPYILSLNRVIELASLTQEIHFVFKSCSILFELIRRFKCIASLDGYFSFFFL